MGRRGQGHKIKIMKQRCGFAANLSQEWRGATGAACTRGRLAGGWRRPRLPTHKLPVSTMWSLTRSISASRLPPGLTPRARHCRCRVLGEPRVRFMGDLPPPDMRRGHRWLPRSPCPLHQPATIQPRLEPKCSTHLDPQVLEQQRLQAGGRCVVRLLAAAQGQQTASASVRRQRRRTGGETCPRRPGIFTGRGQARPGEQTPGRRNLP